MKNSIKTNIYINSLVTALVLASVVQTADAQNTVYPNKTIRMVVPIGAGGGTDTMARLIAQRLSEQMGVTIFIDNRPGAGTVIGTEHFSKTPPDGYTLMTVAPEFSIQPSLRKVPYDPIKDFSFITQLTSGQYFLTTHPTVPVKTPQQFLALAKSRPGQIAFGSSGNGSANHLAGVLFQHMTGTKMIHVPYKSAGAAGTSLIGGEIDFMFSNVASAIAHVRSGRIRAIAATGEKRSPVAPDVPTINEAAVKGFVVTGFYIMMAPAGTPRDIINKLSTDINRVLAMPDTIERLAGAGTDPFPGSPEQFAAFLKVEIDKWGKVVKSIGLKMDN